MFIAPTEVVTVTSFPALEGSRRQAARRSNCQSIPHIESTTGIFREFPEIDKLDGWVSVPRPEGYVHLYLVSNTEVARVDQSREARIRGLAPQFELQK